MLDSPVHTELRAQEAKKTSETQVDHSSHNRPLERSSRQAQEEDDEQHQALEHGEEHPKSHHGAGSERPTPNLLDDAGAPQTRNKSVLGQQERISEREDERAEAFAVSADLTCLLPDHEVERLRAPKEDECVGQTRYQGGGLQRLERAVAGRRVPSGCQQRDCGQTLNERPADSLKRWRVWMAVGRDDVHDQGARVGGGDKVENQGDHADHTQDVGEGPGPVRGDLVKEDVCRLLLVQADNVIRHRDPTVWCISRGEVVEVGHIKDPCARACAQSLQSLPLQCRGVCVRATAASAGNVHPCGGLLAV
mmetsp:Transcript_60798/g.141666  ORF Transcript_60798/g.141666 Transcript_60798/m.141666 type:complete len:307 (-) Transcript_60798:1482-2402(-)